MLELKKTVKNCIKLVNSLSRTANILEEREKKIDSILKKKYQ